MSGAKKPKFRDLLKRKTKKEEIATFQAVVSKTKAELKKAKKGR